MKVAAIDIETNLAHDTIWCVSVVDTATHNLVGTARTPQELWPLISTYDTLVAHYGIGFDFPVLERVWGISLSSFKLLDTCVMARLWYPDIVGGHSLAAWGERIGEPKMVFELEDFDGGWTAEMQEYCEQDTVVLSRLYDYLVFQLSNDSFSQHSIDLEHSVNAITVKQVENGFLLDDGKTAKLWRDARRKQGHIDQVLQMTFTPITTKRVSEKTGKELKDKVEVFNVGSRQQIAKRLTTLGAKFTKFTEKGNVIVDEGALKEMVHIPEAAMCLDYLVQGKRASMLDGWLKAQQDDGRVHGSVNTCGAGTRRMTHSKPNVAQADSAHDMRSCWTVPEGKVLLGVDASGLELRMLAHHINDPSFTA
jgi:DNA polymerase-1